MAEMPESHPEGNGRKSREYGLRLSPRTKRASSRAASTGVCGGRTAVGGRSGFGEILRFLSFGSSIVSVTQRGERRRRPAWPIHRRVSVARQFGSPLPRQSDFSPLLLFLHSASHLIVSARNLSRPGFELCFQVLSLRARKGIIVLAVAGAKREVQRLQKIGILARDKLIILKFSAPATAGGS
jgi:hypothetical protein